MKYFLKAACISAILASFGCASSLNYHAPLKSRMMAIESEYNLPNLNVLYVISKEVHETQDYSSKQFPYADLDSKL
ncbi:MAG: hypothetical protein ABIB71_09415, partial [Candidatus Woesearchaeota archaeon]